MKKHTVKKLVSLAAAAAITLSLAACSGGTQSGSAGTPATSGSAPAQSTGAPDTSGTVYKVGICNYVDDASLNQIVENIEAQLTAIGAEKGVTFEISYDNCNADSTVMN